MEMHMRNWGSRFILGFMAATILAAAPAPKKPPVLPPLLPGESLALAGPDKLIFRFGDTVAEGPLGGLSHLLWLRLEGDPWSADNVQFKCTGTLGPFHCSNPKGHGRLDLARATQASCNLAFIAWAHDSAKEWEEDFGDGAARARMMDVFQPFLGRRAPEGEGIPNLDITWFGEGDMLRTSPEALVAWLIDPAQEDVLRLYRRLLLNVFDEAFKENAWWLDVETAPVAGNPSATQAWAVGGNGPVVAVLRLPPGTTRAEAQARFVAIMIGPKKKK